MQRLRIAWWLIPVLGLAEAAADYGFSLRAPTADEWRQLPALVSTLHRPGDLVVVTPRWAEPLARQALGDSKMPLRDVGRLDATSYAHAIEVSLFGERAAELAGFAEEGTRESSPFTVRRLKNGAHRPTLYRFVEHVDPAELAVTEPDGDEERSCAFTERARPTAGGLPGHTTYPRSRFRCMGGESFFVGVTVIDDENYRPRHCIFAHPPRLGGPLRLRFAAVPAGREIRGGGGMPYLIFRDGVGSPVVLTAFVDGRRIGQSVHRDQAGFTPFQFELPDGLGPTVEVLFEISSADARHREFCFSAEVR